MTDGWPTLEISSKRPVGCDATVRLDGVDISNTLRGLRLSMSCTDVTTVELDVAVIETTELSAEVSAHIPDTTRDLLIRLGWTPPEGST